VLTLSVTLIWLAVVASFLGWNIIEEKSATKRLAFNTGRAFHQLLVTARSWNAGHGGVYVPVTNETQPNPYLKDLLRDLKTDQDLRLTKINPAYMTRQIAEIAMQHQDGIQFHITSLKPIRPANKALDWESTWLKSFEAGKKEEGDFFRSGKTSLFRYMAPLVTEDNCLKCHALQGYRVGDVRGGISVTIPGLSDSVNPALYFGYGSAALFGCVFILLGGLSLEKKQKLLLESNQLLKNKIQERQKTISQLKEANDKVSTLSGIVPICMHCKKIRDDKGYWNQLERFISDHSEAQFSHSVCDKCMAEHYPDDEA